MSVMVSNRTAGCPCCRTYGDNTKTRRLVKTQERHTTTREIAEGIDEFFYAEPVSDEPVIAFEPTEDGLGYQDHLDALNADIDNAFDDWLFSEDVEPFGVFTKVCVGCFDATATVSVDGLAKCGACA